MTPINKAFLQDLRAAMDGALAIVASRHGVAIKCGNATFSDTSATFKVDVRQIGAPDKAEEQAAQRYLSSAHFYGLDPAWHGKPVVYCGHEYTVTGLKPGRGVAAKVCLTRVDGKRYLVPADIFKLRARPVIALGGNHAQA